MNDKHHPARRPVAASRAGNKPKPSDRNSKPLAEHELDKVTGGITITKTQDQSSPDYLKS